MAENSTPTNEYDRNVLRWTIPVDDQWHTPPFVGSIVHVASRDPQVVEIWTSPDVGVSHTSDGTGRVLSESVRVAAGKPNERQFRVFGTGQPVDGLYHGTALVGPFAWHLFSRLRPVASERKHVRPCGSIQCAECYNLRPQPRYSPGQSTSGGGAS